jgi:hypothetical protein
MECVITCYLARFSVEGDYKMFVNVVAEAIIVDELRVQHPELPFYNIGVSYDAQSRSLM